MDIKRVLCLVFTLLLAMQAAYSIDEDELFSRKVELKSGTELSIADCVSLAFKNSPKIKRKKYNLDIAKGNLGVARSVYFPVFSAGVGFYNENNSNDIYYDRTYRNLPSVGVTLNKLIWDFGKSTAMIKMEEFYKIAAEYEFMDSICATLFDTKAKYYKVLKAQAMLNVAKQNLKMYERISEIAVDSTDKKSADANVNLAKVRYLKAENDLKNAKIDLLNSMYLEKPVDFNISITKTFGLSSDFADSVPKNNIFKPEKLEFSKDNAVDIAYKNSPDLQVLVNTRNAMEQNLVYIRRTYFPELNANVGYGFNNNNISNTNNSLQVGVNLSSKVNLMELKHGIKRADAQRALADNEITLFKKDLMFEVNRAFNNIDTSEKQVAVSYGAINNFYDVLKKVEKGYKQGQYDLVTLFWSGIDYIDSLSGYVDSIYDYNLALIQLEMATHSHITDIHHKSEHAMHYHSDDLIKHLIEALNCDEKEEHKHNKREKL